MTTMTTASTMTQENGVVRNSKASDRYTKDQVLTILDEKLSDRKDYEDIRSSYLEAFNSSPLKVHTAERNRTMDRSVRRTSEDNLHQPSTSNVLFRIKRPDSSDKDYTEQVLPVAGKSMESTQPPLPLAQTPSSQPSIVPNYRPQTLPPALPPLISEPVSLPCSFTSLQSQQQPIDSNNTQNGYLSKLLLSPPPPTPTDQPFNASQTQLINSAAMAVFSFSSPDSDMESSTIISKVYPPTKSEPTAGTLDTAEVSQHIREILNAHSIGQRLFARHVLGLSQGTVSELLSKPKHWDKLTEKGRESYRRMNQWASDDNNILSLKAFAPKKGSSVALSTYDQDDGATDERIAQILCEAKTAMQLKQNGTKNEAASSMVETIYRQELARINWSTPDTSSGHPNQLREKPSHKSGKHSSGTNHCNNNNNNNTSEAILRGRKPQTDDKNLTQDLVARIYQEELMKLAAAAKSSGNLDELNVYRQELDRLALTAQQRSRPDNTDEHQNQSTERPENNAGGILNKTMEMRVKSETVLSESRSSMDDELSDRSAVESFNAFDFPQDLRIKKENIGPDLLRHTGSAFTLVRPRSARLSSNSSPPPVPPSSAAAPSTQTPYTSPLVSTDDMSPLQQMQSIANSLLTKAHRPLRAVLPPITQQQIEKYTAVNTDDLVRKIKDMLSQFSISQRLFGENVLGLSQGSVSDLLARPKPWHMLTQKGREPFIRMQVFLEDEESITKLVATQYQIPADKFLRSNSAYSDCMTPGLAPEGGVPTRPSPHSSPSPIIMTTVAATSSTTSSSSSNSCNSNSSNCSIPAKSIDFQPTSHASFSPPVTPHWPKLTNHSIEHAFLDQSDGQANSRRDSFRSNSVVGGCVPQSNGLLPHPLYPSLGMVPPIFPFAPNYFHPSMLLELQRISQQLNGASSTPGNSSSGGSSGSNGGTSTIHQPPSVFEIAAMTHELDTLEITTKVKEVLQFHNLGQKLFGEAVLGLSQGSVSELLSKPKPWHLLSLKGREPFLKMQMWLLDPLSVGRLRLYQDQLKARKRKGSADDQLCDSQFLQKKPRVFFTEDQKLALKQAYQSDPYPNQDVLERLATDLGVGTKTVVNWFHNHRMRAKQQRGATSAASCASGLSPGGSRVVYSGKLDTMSADGDNDDDDDDDDDLSMSSDADMSDPWKMEDEGKEDVERTPSRLTASRNLSFNGDAGFNDGSDMRCTTPSPERCHNNAPPDLDNTSGDDAFSDNQDYDDDDDDDGDTAGRDSRKNLLSMNLAGFSNSHSALLSSKTLDVTSSACSTPMTPDKKKDSVNKRKSARPQWLFEGTALDKNSSAVENGCKEFEEHLKQTAASMMEKTITVKSEVCEQNVEKKNRNHVKKVRARKRKEESSPEKISHSSAAEGNVLPTSPPRSQSGCNYNSNEGRYDDCDLVLKQIANHRSADVINWTKNTATMKQSAID